LIDDAAREAGHEPSWTGPIDRVSIDAGASLQRVADVVKTLADGTGIDHFVIETSFQAVSEEESPETATRILPRIQHG
jgi:hypothetical protein